MKFLIEFSVKCLLLVIFYTMESYSCARINRSQNFSTSCRGDINGCLQKSLQKALPIFANGNPEIGVESLDPLVVQRLDLTLPGGLSIQFSQGYGKGLRNCIVEKARLVENTIETQFACNISIRGKYKSTGRLLMFPINGEGDMSIKCRNLRITNDVTLKTVLKEDGKKYLEIGDVKTKHKFDGRITYNFSNIFKGSPEISKIVMEFINENWRMVAEEFGDPIVEFGISRILDNVKQSFKMIPLEQLLDFPLPI